MSLQLCLICQCIKFHTSCSHFACTYLSRVSMCACSSPLKQGFWVVISPTEWKTQAHGHALLPCGTDKLFVHSSVCYSLPLSIVCSACSAQPTICYSFFWSVYPLKQTTVVLYGMEQFKLMLHFLLCFSQLVCFFSCILRCTHLWNFCVSVCSFSVWLYLSKQVELALSKVGDKHSLSLFDRMMVWCTLLLNVCLSLTSKRGVCPHAHCTHCPNPSCPFMYVIMLCTQPSCYSG